eukprot:CAMPEP_0180449824 /NCGR_PEP_ID=MMETSP1036_2-20121128/17921_1 /TAXON_ID=632150 /ORGANISM="Azadinium spinosum, Strain 3D9" /LENGTH=242 /DNA_ID=CAMNT_0022456243 /DNA_START=50 /DNA_END=778 /DNA_ORIENTATION=+
MTDRFYPLGQPASDDCWKSSYEVQNEMRSFERSAYPPGTAVHLPGARDKFGFSTPGPLKHRLSQSQLALSEEVDNPAPRLNHAIPRMQVADDRKTFAELDVPEMMKSYMSPVASVTLSPGMKSGMSRTRSVPTISKTVAPPRLSAPNPAMTNLQDEHFSYFVPKGLAHEPREKLNSSTLSKLKTENKVSLPFTGEGTGFRSQSSGTDWWAGGAYASDLPTSYRTNYTKPGFYRVSPLQQDAQ